MVKERKIDRRPSNVLVVDGDQLNPFVTCDTGLRWTDGPSTSVSYGHTHPSHSHDGLPLLPPSPRIDISIEIFFFSSPFLVIYPKTHVGCYLHDNIDEDTCDAHTSIPRIDRKGGRDRKILHIERRWRPNDVHVRVRDTPVDEGAGSKDTDVDEPLHPLVDETSSTTMQDTCTGATKNASVPLGGSMHRMVLEEAKK